MFLLVLFLIDSYNQVGSDVLVLKRINDLFSLRNQICASLRHAVCTNKDLIIICPLWAALSGDDARWPAALTTWKQTKIPFFWSVQTFPSVSEWKEATELVGSVTDE